MVLWAAALALFSSPAYESPVRGSGDDLLLLSGAELSATDTVVYEAIPNTLALPPHPLSVPATSDAESGVAEIASAASAPHALAVHLPQALDEDRSYVLWVRNALGEWSNGVRINDARPLWITPDFAYATAPVADLPRVLKVVGRNLHPAPGATTQVRLNGPQTYTIPASSGAAALQRHVATAALPTTLAVGTYSVEVSRDGVSWTALIGDGTPQTFVVLADPPSPQPFHVDDPLYGVGSDFRIARAGVPCQPDDAQDDTPCILNAIHAAKAVGGGTLVFGAGTWSILDPQAHGTFSAVPGDGIVVPPNVNLEGAGAAATTIVRGASWTRSYSTFAVQGPATVRGITFRDESHYTSVGQETGPMLSVGVKWYWADNYGTPPVTRASHVVITSNVFDKPFVAIGNGGLPIDHLFVTHNTFGGAYTNGVYLANDTNNTAYRYDFADSVIAYNTFHPSSYIDPANAQGVIASQINSGRRVDFSHNTADGSSTAFLYNSTDPKGWRAAFFWSTGMNQEMVLVSRNIALCSGDKVGDGEGIVFDSTTQNEAFPSAQPVTSASSTAITVQGTVRTGRIVYGVWQPIPDLNAYYAGAWLRIVQGQGVGQWRKVVSLTTGSNENGPTVTVNVAPALDVVPQPGSLVLVGRGNWQTTIVDNFSDQRQPLCTKANVTRPTGGTLSWYASTADSVMEGNQQFDTNGILLAHQYKEVDPSAGSLEPFTMTQSANEVRGNLIDGEYDWSTPQSASGIFLGYAATPGAGPPPVISYGISIARNTLRRADTTREVTGAAVGAIGLGPSWWTGPHDGQGATWWKMADATLVFHNSLTDINGGGVSRVGIGIDSAYSENTVAWNSVLFANACNNVQTSVVDYGIGTVRHCPTDANSCECNETVAR